MNTESSIVIVGLKGLLAGELAACLEGKRPVCRRSQTDLADLPAAVDVVVFTSALTHVDECFRHPEKGIELTNLHLQRWLEWARKAQRGAEGILNAECRMLNAEGGEPGAAGPPALERGTRSNEERRTKNEEQRAERGALRAPCPPKFIYISSGGIFDGSPQAVKESDPRHPLHPYGMVKALAEFQVMNSGLENWTIVRTDDLFSRDRQFNYPKGATDKFNKPTYAPDVAAGIVRLIELDFRGLIHICGSQLMSKYECVKFFNPNVQPVTMAELNLPSPRPQYENLDTSLAESLGIRVRSVEEAIRTMASGEC